MGNAGNRRAWLALTIVLLAGVAGCLDSGPGSGKAATHEACQAEGWTKTVADAADAAICHPESWREQAHVPGFDPEIMLIAGEGEAGQDFAANLNVIHMEVPEDMTFDGFVDANVDTLPQMITDFELETSQRLDRDLPTHEVSYTGRQGVHELEWRQRMVYEEPTAYVVTYAEPIDRDPVPADTLEDVLDSFSTT